MNIRIILLLLAVSVSSAQDDDFVVKQWLVENGLPQSTVRCITQTPDGYLWIGTWKGLARFDGVRMTIHKPSNTPELYSSNIMSLFTDNRGWLWIGTDQGGLVRYVNGAFTRFDSSSGCPAKRILHMNQDRSGRMWFATEIGIFAYDGRRFLHFTNEDGLPYTYANQASPFADGSMYLGFVGYGSRVRLQGDSLIVMESFPVGGYLVAVDSTGTVWYGDRQKGFVRRKNGMETADREYAGAKPGETYLRRNGEKWLLTTDDIRIISVDGERTFERIENIRLSEITTVFEDREGNIWLGKEGEGLILLRKKNVTVLSQRSGFPSDLVVTGLEDRAGTQWIGTWDAGLISLHQRSGREVRTGHLPKRIVSVFSLYHAKDGSVWAGTWGHGLYRKTGDRFHRVERGIADSVTSIVSIAEDRYGGMWVATAHNGVQYFHGAQEKVWDMKAGLSGNRVNAVLAAANGDIWVTISGNGVNRIAEGKVTVFRKGSGLNDDFASPLYEDKAGAVWVGTNNGLARWKNGTFSFVTEEQGLPDGVIAQIIEDDLGYFWIGAIHGICRVSAEELNAAADGTVTEIHPFTIGKEDGMLNEETGGGGTPRCWKSADGTISFTTSKGVVVIDPRNVTSNPFAPSVIIEEASVENSPVPMGSEIVLDPGETKVELRYTGINFTAPAKIRFKYRLFGFEERWNDAGTVRFAQYTNLDPGEYRFHVQAENSAGVVNTEGASVRIIVLPPFYKTWWFRFLLVALFLSIGPAVYLIRARQWKKEQERQIEFSRRLIESQESERKRIANELHDGLGQNLLIIKNKLLLALQSFNGDAGSVQQVTEASGVVSSTIEEVRSISHNLRPHQLDQLGITKTLRSIVRQANESTAIEFSAEIQDIDGCLSPEQEIGLFRIVQESFNNIIKHSGASTVSVQIVRGDHAITVTVHDNGKGFRVQTIDGPHQADGFGITGMFERSKMFNWQMSIESKEGTRLHVTIPLVKK